MKDLYYKVKCRNCGSVTDMYWGEVQENNIKMLKLWISEHSSFPIEKQCTCDNGSMLLHDIIGYGNVLDLLRKE